MSRYRPQALGVTKADIASYVILPEGMFQAMRYRRIGRLSSLREMSTRSINLVLRIALTARSYIICLLSTLGAESA